MALPALRIVGFAAHREESVLVYELFTDAVGCTYVSIRRSNAKPRGVTVGKHLNAMRDGEKFLLDAWVNLERDGWKVTALRDL